MANINNTDSGVTLVGSAEADSIYNDASNVVINANGGDDTIKNYYSNVTINAGAGDDTVYSNGDSSSINGGDGNDTITNYYGYYTTISGGSGNDSIINNGYGTYVDGGSGNDTIEGAGAVILFGIGSGKDIVTNYKSNSIKLTSGTIQTTLTSGADVILGLNANDSLTLKNAAQKYIAIENADGTDTIINEEKKGKYVRNRTNNTLVSGGIGDDTIYVEGTNVTIDTDGGDDYIYVYDDAESVTINSGAGDDTVMTYGKNITVNLGEGKNSVEVVAGTATINVNGGQDTVYASSYYAPKVLVQGNNKADQIWIDGYYNATVEPDLTVSGGKGDDTIYGSRNKDIFSYAAGDGNDVIMNYSGEDVIHLGSSKLDSYSFDGGDLIFYVGDGSLRLKNMTNHAITVTDSTGTSTKLYSNGYTPQQVIKNLVQAWNKTALANRSTVKLDESIQLCSQFNSIQEVIDKMVADCRRVNNAETFLRDYCGIITNNTDIGALTGWEMGGLKIKDRDNIVPETLPAQEIENFSGTTFVRRNLTVTIAEDEDTLSAYPNGKEILNAAYSWWVEESIKLIEEGYGFYFREGDTLSLGIGTGNFSGRTSGNSIKMNSDSAGTFAHELTHLAQGYFMGRFPEFLQEGLARLTSQGYYSEAIAGNADSLATYLDLEHFDTGESRYYEAGYMFYRYLGKQVADAYDSLGSYAWKDGSSITGTAAAELLTGSGSNQTISGGDGADTITAYGKNSKVYGDAGADYIVIGKSAENLTVYGGAGADSLVNYASNSTLDGGADNDTITNYGESVVVNGGTGNDRIYNDVVYTNETKGSVTSYFYLDKENVTINAGVGDDYISNQGSRASISGGDGADTISNGRRVTSSTYVTDSTGSHLRDSVNVIYGNDTTIFGGAGNDSIRNNVGSNVKIDGGAGNDTIYSRGDNVQIYGGDGNDSLLANEDSEYDYDSETWNDVIRDRATLDGGAGNDTIQNYNTNALLNGGSGDDYMRNYGDNSALDGGEGDDSIRNYGENSTLSGGSGNDTVYNYSTNSLLNGGPGDDYMRNYTANSTIDGGAGNDLINNFGDSVQVYGGEGDDTLYVYQTSEYDYDAQAWKYTTHDRTTVDGGAGDDRIENYNTCALLLGGTGNDSIRNYSDSATIIGGSGDDSVYTNAANTTFLYATGDGNDTIVGVKAGDTLKITGGSYKTTTVGSDLVVQVSDGSINLRNAASVDFKIVGEENSASGEIINNTASATVITGSANGDSITNSGKNVTIYAGDGNDTIRNSAAFVTPWGALRFESVTSENESTTDGGAGDDIIEGYSGSLSGGAGNDLISLGSVDYGSATINGGTDNDTIYGNGSLTFSVLYQYAQGDGNDVIYNFNSADTLQVTKGTYATLKSGTDFVVSLGTGAVTLKNALTDDYSKIRLQNSTGKVEIYNDWKNRYGTAQNDTILNIDESVGIYAQAGDDSIFSDKYYVTLSGGAGNDTIHNYNGDYSSVDGGTGNDYITSYSNDAVTITGGAGNDTIIGMWGTSSISGGDGDDSIKGDGGNVRVSTIDGGSGNDTITGEYDYCSILGGAGDDKISITSNDAFPYWRGNSTVVGGTGNDEIYLDKNNMNSLIQYAAGDGFDTIIGYDTLDSLQITGSYKTERKSGDVLISVGSGSMLLKDFSADTLSVNGEVVTIGVNSEIITGTEGADSIQNSLSGVTIKALGGDDTIDNSGSNVVIDAGAGNDSINNTGANTFIEGGAGKDFIYNSSHHVTLDGGAGDDTIYSYGTQESAHYRDYDYMVIIGGAGNDSIYRSHGYYDTIYGGDGNDTIFVNSSFSKVFGGSGDDVIDNHWNNTVDAGDGNDTITTAVGSVNGGAGDDVLRLNASNKATAKGGLGNDLVYIYGSYSHGGHLYQYELGDGLDTITGFRSSDTLQITGGTYSTLASGNDVIVKVGSGSITLSDAKNVKFNINGTYKAEATIPAGISISGDVLTANAKYTGNSIDLADYPSTVTKVNASALTSGVIILGSAAANSLKGSTYNDTIYGGAGADTVSLGGGNDVYVYSTGNDLIQDYTAGADKIKLASASLTSASVSGSDVVLKTSSGSLTVKNGKGRALTIIDSSGSETTKVYPESPADTLPVGLTYDSMKKMLTVGKNYGGAALDLKNFATDAKAVNANAFTQKIKITGNNLGNSLIGGSGADTLVGGKGNDTLTGGGGKDVFVYETGGGADVIADFTSGQDSIRLASGTVASAALKNSDMIFKIGSGSLTVKNGNGKDISIGSAIYHDNLIFDSKKTAVTLGSAFSGTLKSSDLGAKTKTITATGLSKGVNIVGNSTANSIFGGSGADTLNGGAGADTLTGGGGKDVFVYEVGGGNDVIADFTVGQDSIKLASGSVASVTLKKSDMVFKIGSGSLTVKNGKGKDISIGSAIYHDNLIFDSKKTAVTLGSAFSGTLKSSDLGAKTKTITATGLSKGVNIVGNSTANSIFGGSGADTLAGGKGNDTLKGNGGADVFVYANGDGADVIEDFAAGDKIYLASGFVASVALKKSDMVFKIGSGSLTVRNGKGKDISIGGAIYHDNLIFDSKKTAVTLGSAFSGTLQSFDLGAKTKTVDATTTTKAIKIFGNSVANEIFGGKGADTLDGGAGNDTLTGGAGKDVFVYGSGGGRDVITDYTAGQDKIKISSGAISKTSYSGADVVFTIGSGSLTVKNGKGKKITIVDANNKSTTQTYSGAVSGTTALLADNNFIGGAPTLDEISTVTENNYSVRQIGTASVGGIFAQNSQPVYFSARTK